jgi:hypothetical protein
MGIFSVLTKRQSFEDQLKRLKFILDGVIADGDRIVSNRIIDELQVVNAECVRRGYSNTERFKAVEGAFAFRMWIYQHGAEPSPLQRRVAGVPDWFPID